MLCKHTHTLRRVSQIFKTAAKSRDISSNCSDPAVSAIERRAGVGEEEVKAGGSFTTVTNAAIVNLILVVRLPLSGRDIERVRITQSDAAKEAPTNFGEAGFRYLSLSLSLVLVV